MKPRLTEAGFKEAANSLGVDIPSIKAVAEVESRGAGFLPDGRPVILFERHKFHKYTQGLFSADHPDISNPKAGGYGRPGTHQWDRYDKAHALDPVAAMKSASYGKFQIMGFNYEAAGFRSVHDFVEAMNVSEDEQLKAFVNFVKANGLADELKRKDWAGFARGYNGADYKKNAYDIKMAAAYRKHSKARVEPEATAKPLDVDKGVTASDKPPEDSSGTPPPTPAAEVKASEVSLWTRITSISIPAGVITILGGIGKFVGGLPPYVWIAFSVLALAAMIIGFLIWRDKNSQAHERTKIVMGAAADREKNNLRLI